MKNLDSRKRIVFLATVLAVLHILIANIDLPGLLNLELSVNIISPLILSLVAYLGSYWMLYFKVKGERFATVLLFPSIAIFAISILVELIIATIISNIGQFSLLIMSGIFIWGFLYVVLLTVNILNASSLQDIPLGQAARAALFVLSLAISYLLNFLLFSNQLFLPVRVVLVMVLAFTLVYICLWSIKLAFYPKMLSALNVAFISAFAALVLSLWPVAAPYSSLVTTLVLYVCLGIALEVREIISKWIWVEYISLFSLIFILLALVAEWGINGTLI